ncbi:MAG: DUF1043 family protein, partial [Gammaproteobacteria bacterium]|nr:DUF1043 family protein [Gammaproteobacteria bacterium]
DLEAELESARDENTEYRREVFDQFAETARKFRNLDESYQDLHRQLAESASVLCGEAAGPLLEAPVAQKSLAMAEADEAAEAEDTADVAEVVVSAPDPVVEPSDQAEPNAEIKEVPILLAEAGEPAVANGDSTPDAAPARSRADDAA